MFSSRLAWDLRPNRLADALGEMRRRGADILDLTQSNPTRAGIRYPAHEVLDALADPRAIHYDPAPTGLTEAREAVAAYYAARGLAVEPARILLTCSTSEAYAYLFKLLADPGDQVLVPRPSYPLFDYLAALESIRVTPYPLLYDHGWSIDLESLARAAGPHTRAVVLVHPNNPTGSFVKRAELDRLLALCAERRLALICDEVFADFAFAPDPARAPSLAGTDREVLAFCLSGLSKVAALPQMKLAWIVAAGPPALRAAALERLELIADTYLSVGAPVQWAAAALLESADPARQQIRTRLADNLAALRSAVKDSPCQVLEVEGGWYATIQVPRTRTEEEWCLDLLLKECVLVQPGFFYDFPSEAFLVASLLTDPRVFQQGISRLIAAAP